MQPLLAVFATVLENPHNLSFRASYIDCNLDGTQSSIYIVPIMGALVSNSLIIKLLNSLLPSTLLDIVDVLQGALQEI